MSISQLLTSKISHKNDLQSRFNINSSKRALGLICHGVKVTEDFLEGLSYCDADFLIIGDDTLTCSASNLHFTGKDKVMDLKEGLDFFVCDGEIENVQDYLSVGIAPIIYKENHLHSLLKEFNPMKGEGNSFMYDSENKWSIYASLVKYLENYKFPYDNKNLVKNIAQV